MSSSDRSLTPDVIAIIKATIPALEAHGLDITTEMYRRLLADPAIAEMFDPTHQSKGTQPRALAMAVLAYAKNIDNLGVLGGAVNALPRSMSVWKSCPNIIHMSQRRFLERSSMFWVRPRHQQSWMPGVGHTGLWPIF